MNPRALVALGMLTAVLAGCLSDDDAFDFRFEVAPTVDPDPPVANEAFNLNFRVRNTGDYDAEDVRWTVYRDGTEAETGLLDIDSHESRDVSVLMDPDTAGPHTYRVELDPRDRFDEDD